MRKETTGVLSLIGAAIMWGTSGTAQTFAPTGFDPMEIGMMRIAIGGAALMILAIMRGELGFPHAWPIKLTLICGLSVAAFQLFFFSAVHQVGVAVGTIVGLGSTPIIAGILVFLLYGEWPGGRWLGTTLLAIAGCSLLVLASHGEHVSIKPTGLLLACGAGGAYAAYALTVKKLLARHSSLAVMAVVGCLGALLLIPVLWGHDFSWLLSPGGGVVALYLGLFSYALPMVLFANGLSVTPAPKALTITLTEPLTAGLLGILVVGEHLSLMAWGGLLMMLGGLIVVTVPVRRPTQSDRSDQA